MKRKLSSEEISWQETHPFPIWVEFHIQQLARELDRQGRSKEILETVVEEECKKLDKFCEILCTTNKTHREAEKEVYGTDDFFYDEYERWKTNHERYIARVRRKEELEKQKELELQRRVARGEILKPEPRDFGANLYLEKDLSKEKQETLLGKGYKRLKISPFGDSGAAYYWVKTRYNESKEHAFFCYLVEAELKKYVKKVTLNVTGGPDVVFKHGNRTYCFDVETGENKARNPAYLKRKFANYKKQYAQSFILVTSKKLKYSYKKYGTVVTRNKFRETIADLFQ